MRRLTIWRRITQLTVIALFCALPFINQAGFNEISGSLFAFELFGLPFADPAHGLQTAADAAIHGLPPGMSLFLGSLLALIVAFLLGRVFCGWLCPYGFFSELAWHLRGRGNHGIARINYGRAFLGKSLLFLACMAVLIIWGLPLLGLISFPGELSLLPLDLTGLQPWTDYLLLCGAPLAALLLELVVGRRFWCAKFCPQSVMLGVAAWLLPKKCPGLRIGYQPKKCICGKNSPCREACSLNLNPRQKGGPKRRDCMMCGDCLRACAHYGKALVWSGRE